MIFCFGKRNISFLKCLQTPELVGSLLRNPLDGRSIHSPLEQETQQRHCKPADAQTLKLYIRQGDRKQSRVYCQHYCACQQLQR